MTKEMMMAQIEALGHDAFVDEYEEDGEMVISVTLRDFEGFDDDWSEIMRDYDHPEQVEAFEEMLEEECIEEFGDLYGYYVFDGFTVELGYSSFDI